MQGMFQEELASRSIQVKSSAHITSIHSLERDDEDRVFEQRHTMIDRDSRFRQLKIKRTTRRTRVKETLFHIRPNLYYHSNTESEVRKIRRSRNRDLQMSRDPFLRSPYGKTCFWFLFKDKTLPHGQSPMVHRARPFPPSHMHEVKGPKRKKKEATLFPRCHLFLPV